MRNGEKNGVKRSMEKYENDNFIEEQNMDGVDPDYDATYGSDYNPEDDSAVVSEHADETGYEQEEEELNSDETYDYDLEYSESEETEFEGADSDETDSEEEEPYYDRKSFKWLRTENRAKFIKLVSLLVLSAAILIFASIAWFTMNGEVGNGGMDVTVARSNFEITMLSGSRDGIYKDVHKEVHDESALYWEMTASNNLINYEPGDQGIKPGSWGEISFNVIPKVENLNLKFDFEVIGYHMLTTNDNGTPDDPTDDTKKLTALTDLPDHSGDVAQIILNGHILLFENRTVTGESGSEVITYSDPILSDDDMHRVFYKAVSGIGTENPVNIYWVWPNTLSTLVDARAHSGITTVPFCSGVSYMAVTGNIVSFPHYYLKGASSSDRILISDIVARYDTYGDMYDQGDNEIGMRVNYVLIKLTVSEGTAGGGGS